MVTVGELHEVLLREIAALYQIKREIPRKSKKMPCVFAASNFGAEC